MPSPPLFTSRAIDLRLGQEDKQFLFVGRAHTKGQGPHGMPGRSLPVRQASRLSGRPFVYSRYAAASRFVMGVAPHRHHGRFDADPDCSGRQNAGGWIGRL